MMENLQNIEEECRKEVFVESYLKPLLIGLHIEIVSAEYHKNQHGDETVTVIYRNGYKKHINVNCDSLTAIVIDVMKSVQ